MKRMPNNRPWSATMLLVLVAMLALTACGDDDYVYPSVKLEFLTASSDSSGDLSSVLTDDGTAYEVLADASSLSTTPDSIVRIVSYYETLTDANGSTGVKLYSASTAIAPYAKAADEFEEGVITKPAAVRSIWLGRNYLNIVLTATQTGTHTIGFVEQSTEPNDDGTPAVDILLYHDTSSDVVDYTKTAYLSVPLLPYATDDGSTLSISFSLYTDETTVKTYTFSYTPALDSE